MACCYNCVSNATIPCVIQQMRFISISCGIWMIGVCQFWSEGPGMRVQVTEGIRYAAGELRVRHGGGAVVTRTRWWQTGVSSLVRISAMMLAVVVLMIVAVVILLPEAAGVGGGVVQGAGSSQPRRDVEVTEIKWPRDLRRKGGGGQGRGCEVGGAQTLEEAAAGARRGVLGVRVLVHTQQLPDPVTQQRGASLRLLAWHRHSSLTLATISGQCPHLFPRPGCCW